MRRCRPLQPQSCLQGKAAPSCDLSQGCPDTGCRQARKSRQQPGLLPCRRSRAGSRIWRQRGAGPAAVRCGRAAPAPLPTHATLPPGRLRQQRRQPAGPRAALPCGCHPRCCSLQPARVPLVAVQAGHERSVDVHRGDGAGASCRLEGLEMRSTVLTLATIMGRLQAGTRHDAAEAA